MKETPHYRHELKFQIGIPEYLSLKQKLRTALECDPYADSNGQYTVTSLYLDNCFDKALREKRHGTNQREKFRLRYYGDNPEFVLLEKKQKHNNLCLKTSTYMSLNQCDRLLKGDWQWLLSADDGLLYELGYKMTTQLLRPKTVVRYVRDPFVYPTGNVRITLDHNICGGLSAGWFLDSNLLTVTGCEPGTIILEVKYDEFLPDFIRVLLQPHCTQLHAFSKYAECRSYEY